ncbi:serine/threonine protein kinase [Streptomyces sp. SCSIO 30461]|uniref:serine/threonine protein kinase n=1 Tax=Streptomyces sp. SCSIO 30461 TaxID=3118085 RepID=UPI0030D02B1C
MDDYAGRVLAERYRLPLPPSDGYELVETRAFDTYSGQEVVVRQLPLPEVVDAEVLDTTGQTAGYGQGHRQGYGYVGSPRAAAGATRRPADPAVRRAVEAAQAAAQIPDHPLLDQVFDVFAESGSLWIVSELIAARPLAALLAERPLSPYRAAEIGSDVLTALRALHAHGWTHRNVTVRTVLVCDDGRVVLTGLAAGAAEEALCGYAPVPDPGGEVIEAQPDHLPRSSAPFDLPDRSDRSDRSDPSAPSATDRSGPPALPAETAPLPWQPGARAPYTSQDYGYGFGEGSDATSDTRAPHAGEPRQGGGRGVGRLHHPGVSDGPASAPVPVPGPNWWSRPAAGGGAHDLVDDACDAYDADADADDDGDFEGYPSGPPRARLAGTWRDGPHVGVDGSTPVAAGGGASPYGRGASGADALRADAQRLPVQASHGARPGATGVPGSTSGTGRGAAAWDEAVAAEGSSAPGYRGPATPLAAERARQARIAVVGAVTERWAPEQAGPVHGTWQLAPPVGPTTDLWALGALLFRAVQGHAPYPEESATELVQMVCAEPPAFAEECGPLRPVVESLLRQDPTERPDFEELRGWLRSLIRSAPEPDAGVAVIPLPSADGTRLPVVRRRGELVRRRRGGLPDATHGRHRHRKPRQARQAAEPARFREPRGPRSGRSPRSLGRLLLVLILLVLAAAIAYAVLFMPKAGGQKPSSGQSGGASDQAVAGSVLPGPGSPPSEAGTRQPSQTPVGGKPEASGPAVELADGYVLRDDPEGFRIAVDETWQRRSLNDSGQVRYTGGDFTLIVVPGRDTVQENGSDPMAYQRGTERELQPFRESTWSSASGLRRIDVGKQAMAEGQFTWQDSGGREVYVRNLAMIVGDRYHVIQVIGPEGQRDDITEIYQQATKSYRPGR